MAITFKSVLAGGAGYEIYVTTSDTSLYGVTLTLSKSGTTVGTAVVDNQGEAKFTVKETGTYTITFTTQGTTYTETVEVSAYEVEIEAGFQFKRWLGLTDLDPDDYASLAAVLADEEAVRQLMTRHAAVDYLASFTSDDTSVVAILNNDLAAKWITCTAYAEDVLTDAYSALMESIGKYGYGKWVLQGQVPKMTSATAPYGTVSANSYFVYSGYNFEPWHAFDGQANAETSTAWSWRVQNDTTHLDGVWIRYKFLTPTIVKEVSIVNESATTAETSMFAKNVKVQGSNDDGATWEDIDTFVNQLVARPASTRYPINNDTAYTDYRLFFVDNYAGTFVSRNRADVGIGEIQFYAYAPLGNVPIMTSNTAPYGEASASSVYSSHTANCVFDGNESSFWQTSSSSGSVYIGYKFTTPTKILRAYVRGDAQYMSRFGNAVFQGSNDGFSSDIHDLTEAQALTNGYIDFTKNTGYYLAYRLYSASTSGQPFLYTLQFYGRQMTVSVPKMDTNTSPYGEAIGDAEWGYSAVADGLRWRVFDKDTTTTIGKVSGKNTGTIGYKFPSPVVIREIYLYGNYSAGAQTIQLQGSNDGVTYENVGSVFTYNQSLAYTIIEVTNNTPYAYYLLNITGSTSTSLAFRELNFFGVDYSEKEWDTDHPRHYIYDHGVELESLGSPIVYGSPTVEKKSYEILGGTNSGSNGYAFAPETAIDITPYNLMRMIAGDQAMGSTYTSNWGIKLARSYGTGDLTMIALLSISTPISLELGLDVSNVNQSAYPMLAQATSGGSITKMSLTEWWLE